jgi:zinc protease
MIALDRSRPPRTPEMPGFKLPPIEELRLGNGLSVVLVEDRRFPLVTVRLGFDAGSKYEPAELAGLADTTAAVLTEGTRTRTAKQISDQAMHLGGSVRADAAADSLVVAGNSLAENADRMLALVADVTRNAIFPEDEVELRKENSKQELLAQLADAGFLADERMNQVVFGSHAYARQEPTLASLDRLTRDALEMFALRHLAPNNAVLVMLGDLPANARSLIESHFGDWAPKTVPEPPLASFPHPQRSVALLNRAGSVQADVRIARTAVTRTNPDYFPLLVGNTILGGGASSRLFMNVREEKGYAYDARSMVHAMRDGGLFAASTQVRNEVLQAAIEIVIDELRRMGGEPVAADELATAKNYLSGTFVMRLETQESLAAQIAGTKLMGLPLEYLEQYTSNVRAVDAGRIRDAAARYFRPDDAAIVVVGDAEALAPQLAPFGGVVVEDAAEASA